MSLLLLGALDAHEYANWRAHLAKHLSLAETLVSGDAPHDADAIDIALVANPPAGALARYGNLRFIQSLWAGVDRLLSDPALPKVPVARLIDPDLTQAMIEGVVAHVLALHRQAPAYARQQVSREWVQRDQPLARERKVAILGLGELGAAVAQALASLGFDTCGWSRRARIVPGIESYAGAAGLDALLQKADILVNLLPLTPETTGLIDRSFLARLPRGASLVNVARGAHVVDADLLAALDAGHVDHATLDVFRDEPLPQGHRFWSHPRVTITPHVAAYSAPASAARLAAANVAAFRQGLPVKGLVDSSRGY